MRSSPSELGIPAGVVVRPSPYMDLPGKVLILPNYEHPEAGSPLGGEVPDGRLVICHPDDEQRVRDAIAVAQETPKWWLDWQRFERMLKEAFGA